MGLIGLFFVDGERLSTKVEIEWVLLGAGMAPLSQKDANLAQSDDDFLAQRRKTETFRLRFCDFVKNPNVQGQ